jgi:hypothetical protein
MGGGGVVGKGKLIAEACFLYKTKKEKTNIQIKDQINTSLTTSQWA